MGAMDPARWHSWHFAWRMGATSLANVTGFPSSAAAEKLASANRAPRIGMARFMTRSFHTATSLTGVRHGVKGSAAPAPASHPPECRQPTARLLRWRDVEEENPTRLPTADLCLGERDAICAPMNQPLIALVHT